MEVEAYVDHDAIMDSWPRLETGMALLAQTHNLLRQLQVGEEGRRPRFANHLESADVAAAVRRGTVRIRSWEPTPAERRLAAVVAQFIMACLSASSLRIRWTSPQSTMPFGQEGRRFSRRHLLRHSPQIKSPRQFSQLFPQFEEIVTIERDDLSR